jgi:hypothetical protein
MEGTMPSFTLSRKMSKNPPNRPQVPQEQWVRTRRRSEFMTFLPKSENLIAGTKTSILDNDDNDDTGEDDVIRNIQVQILEVMESKTGLDGFLKVKKAPGKTYIETLPGGGTQEFPTWTFEDRFDGQTHNALFANFAKLASTGVNKSECVLVLFKILQAEREDRSTRRNKKRFKP